MKRKGSSSTNVHSFFEDVDELDEDAIFGLMQRYRADTDPNKLDLGIGAYRDEHGKPVVLPCIKKASQILTEQLVSDEINKEYLPIQGFEPFYSAAANVVFGQSVSKSDFHLFSAQALSGTGALRVAFDFLKKALPKETKVYISKPTWGNHAKLLRAAGLPFAYYRYWDPKTKGLDFKGLIEDLTAAPTGSVVVLHACAHNPTGVDPTREQWNAIADLVLERRLFVVFDSAYQGYASGDLDKDAFAIRLFVERDIELFVAQSFSKNLGLYGERAGALHLVVASEDAGRASYSQIKQIIRATYSNPPRHGAQLAATVMNTPELYKDWCASLRAMSERITKMRHELRAELERLGVPGPWNHLTDQIGMFSFTGLTADQSRTLTNDHHIYMLSNGRISMAGLSSSRIPQFAQALKEVLANK